MINTKTKGELGRRIEYDVEHDLFHPQNIYSDEYITPTFIEYVRKLEKENAELKEKSKRQSNNYKHDIDMLIEGNKYKNEVCKELAHQANIIQDQLTKAKFLLKHLVDAFPKSYSDVVKDTLEEAEQFLKDSEVEK